MSFVVLAPLIGLMLGKWWGSRKRLYVRKPKIKRMSDEEYEKYEEVKYIQIETKYNTLIKLIDKKIIDLQDQLLRHSYDDSFKLGDNDIIRYSAMVEVLKTVKET